MADAFDDEIEPAMTINEFIDAAEEADIMLGGYEGDKCTYSNGYMKRQAVFSCLTCVPDGTGGVCTACAISCHDGHEVVELSTKRNFRCDCGNSKFGEFCCKLFPDKDPKNVDNSYNQNFKGLYCTCNQPFADPEADDEVGIIQCCICEDWFHTNHLGINYDAEIPNDGEGEFICQECAVHCSFLKLYPSSILAELRQKSSPDETGLDEGTSCTYSKKIASDYLVLENASNRTDVHSEPDVTLEDKKLVDSETSKSLCLENPVICSGGTTSSVKCVLGGNVNAATLVMHEKKPMFLSEKWRQILCTCQTCTEFYSQKGIGYLIDKEDSLEEYENKAKVKRDEKLQKQEEAESNFLRNLSHVQKIEFLRSIADMKDEFQSFLESFDHSRPISGDDVRGIFKKLSEKRRRLY